MYNSERPAEEGRRMGNAETPLPVAFARQQAEPRRL